MGVVVEKIHRPIVNTVSNEKISKEKVNKKRISGEACDKNKQTTYTVPKSKIESRAQYAPEPARGICAVKTSCWKICYWKKVNGVINQLCCAAGAGRLLQAASRRRALDSRTLPNTHTTVLSTNPAEPIS